MKLLYLHGRSLDARTADILQVLNMCQAFSQLGVEVTLALPDSQNRSTDPSATILEKLGQQPGFEVMTYKKISLVGRFEILGNYLGARSLLGKVRADLCFVRDPLLLSLAMRAELPVIFEAHNSHFHNRNKLLREFWDRQVKKQAQNNQLLKFITISKALYQCWLSKGVHEQKLIVIHDGFNQDQFSDQTTKSKAREILFLPSNQKIVVYTGSLGPDRGIDRILSLAQRFPKAFFVVVGGDVDQRQDYHNLSIKTGMDNVLWTGYVSQAKIPDYLRAADVLLLLLSWRVPTIDFCSPLKMFEYMAAGRIIVGEAFPTITEVLEHNWTAYLAKPDDFDDLCLNLDRALMGTDKEKIAQMAQKRAFANFTWECRARKILNSLDGVWDQDK